MRTTIWFSAAFLMGSVALVACGDDETSATSSGATTTTTTTTSTTTTSTGGGAGGEMTGGGMGGTGGMGGGAGGMGNGGAGGGSNVAEIVDCASVTPAATINAAISGFNPAMATIAAGEVVRFNNTDVAIAHTSTSGTVNGVTKMPDGIWNTGSIAAGGSACVQINVAGTYPYYCDPHHLTMQGTIVVQ